MNDLGIDIEQMFNETHRCLLCPHVKIIRTNEKSIVLRVQKDIYDGNDLFDIMKKSQKTTTLKPYLIIINGIECQLKDINMIRSRDIKINVYDNEYHECIQKTIVLSDLSTNLKRINYNENIADHQDTSIFPYKIADLRCVDKDEANSVLKSAGNHKKIQNQTLNIMVLLRRKIS